MTIRLPPELDSALEEIARQRHTSKHALIVEAASLAVERYSRREEIDAGLQFVLSHDAELLQRLEDA
ncbi:hypothetical protein GY21_18630 [Cryobacterium roopkundense]|uniref:Putative transcriptional regulator n=1 Tax=Cryobacterium roopkundense TaxID=1001240 RepID=A0A099J3E7_9MICO|nr:ribbon-helix-helix protein, CopG family [Cryobacterium roopkundense]KGJ71963.1 hypothetical protein GY21_18630 [Cryobacterium roopkundense]MBB5643360.1 putative transcriptional regulator [Cryobacterium roopkundense]